MTVHETHPGFSYNAAPNPGGPGWAAAGALAGRYAGAFGGLLLGSVLREYEEDEWEAAKRGELTEAERADLRERMHRSITAMFVSSWALGTATGAAGAAIGAPPELQSRAALGAAIGGAVPIFGAPLAALGAYIATRPKNDRENNPTSTAATAALAVLALAALGGLTYAGVRLTQAKIQRELPASQ